LKKLSNRPKAGDAVQRQVLFNSRRNTATVPPHGSFGRVARAVQPTVAISA